jgi:hypothetical protein
MLLRLIDRRYKMIEWKRLPRSIRFENNEVACDVWPATSYDGLAKRYKYTVYKTKQQNPILIMVLN